MTEKRTVFLIENEPSCRFLLRSALAISAAMLFGQAGVHTTDRTVRDGAGRSVPLLGMVARVLPAGAPASILLWNLAPQLMTGWIWASEHS